VSSIFKYGLILFVSFQIGAPETCPATNVGKCSGDSDDWEGDFFPGIPKIKYEVNFISQFINFLFSP
jgi:hypothetical protein